MSETPERVRKLAHRILGLDNGGDLELIAELGQSLARLVEDALQDLHEQNERLRALVSVRGISDLQDEIARLDTRVKELETAAEGE